jgi:hypothetical protein
MLLLTNIPNVSGFKHIGESCVMGHRFCNEECRRNGLEEHEPWCQQYACWKLSTFMEGLSGGSSSRLSNDSHTMCYTTRSSQPAPIGETTHFTHTHSRDVHPWMQPRDRRWGTGWWP